MFELVFKDFLEFFDFGLDDGTAVGLVAVEVEVVLVIVFSGVEGCGFFDGGNDGLTVDVLVIEFLLVFLCKGLLGVVVIKDHGAVLRADIITLTVECSRVVCFPEDFKQFIVADLFRIVGDLEHFRMTGGAGAYFFISRVGH